ncbi:MAG: polysaccharide deacetylase family protein [Janthinobacterium lividum]
MRSSASARIATRLRGHARVVLACAAAFGCIGVAAQGVCRKPVYLTFDTGHMGVAPLVAEVLARQNVRVTFFVAAERTLTDGDSLDSHWAAWWKARAAEGNEFASHTYDHAYWRADERGAVPGFRIRPSAGAYAGRESSWTAAQYCENVAKASDRIAQLTGRKPLPLFRAPGGKTSPELLAAAEACGFKYVGWAPAGFLGDELPSEKFGNDLLLKQALERIRPGDILLAHLGIWSRKEPWAPAVLEPLIVGLKARGFCFETLRRNPVYSTWIASHS